MSRRGGPQSSRSTGRGCRNPPQLTQGLKPVYQAIVVSSPRPLIQSRVGSPLAPRGKATGADGTPRDAPVQDGANGVRIEFSVNHVDRACAEAAHRSEPISRGQSEQFRGMMRAVPELTAKAEDSGGWGGCVGCAIVAALVPVVLLFGAGFIWNFLVPPQLHDQRVEGYHPPDPVGFSRISGRDVLDRDCRLYGGEPTPWRSGLGREGEVRDERVVWVGEIAHVVYMPPADAPLQEWQ